MTLSQNPLWSAVIQRMSATNSFGNTLPIICNKHRKLQQVEYPQQWKDTFGGCSQPCNDVLPCGHVCTLKCHPFGHDAVECAKKCERVLACGHQCSAGHCCQPCRCECGAINSAQNGSYINSACTSSPGLDHAHAKVSSTLDRNLTDNGDLTWAHGQFYSGGNPDHPQGNIHLPAQDTNQLDYQTASRLGQNSRQRMRNGASNWRTPELYGDSSMSSTPDTLSISSDAFSTRFTPEDQLRSKVLWNSYADGGVLQDDMMRGAAFEAQAQPYITPTYEVVHKVRRRSDYSVPAARAADKQDARPAKSQSIEADTPRQPKSFKHISGRSYNKKATTTVPHRPAGEAVEENLINL
jgi:hypothetical protein